MAVYAVGDLQGCAASLRALLARLAFDPARDRLLLVGDLVNRGPDSLGVLRWAREHEACVRSVLGNHDLHLLAVAAGLRQLGRRDTLGPLLAAPDAPELLDWLRRRPLLHEEEGLAVVHAGLFPNWDWPTARELAREFEAALTEGDGHAALAAVGGDDSGTGGWRPGLRGRARLSRILEGFTRLRTCRADGRGCAEFNGPPSEAPHGCTPWFDLPDAAWRGGPRVLFGHWAALGLHVAPHVVGLDTGCVWGGRLTALRVDDDAVFSVPAARGDGRSPG